jgi:hypothetical protein
VNRATNGLAAYRKRRWRRPRRGARSSDPCGTRACAAGLGELTVAPRPRAAGLRWRNPPEASRGRQQARSSGLRRKAPHRLRGRRNARPHRSHGTGWIVRPEIGFREPEPLPRLASCQIENSGESRLEFVKFPGQELISRQTLSLSGALELGNNCVPVEGKIERCEAARCIPPTAVDASAERTRGAPRARRPTTPFRARLIALSAEAQEPSTGGVRISAQRG